jgi:hypothetical protein
MTMLEAMAHGKAVVGSRVGGIPELVAEGTTGYLFDPRDVPTLQQRIGYLMRDFALRTRMGERARIRAGGLAVCGRHSRAVARRIDVEPRGHHGAEQISVAALAQLGLDHVIAVIRPWIGENADASEHAGIVEERRHDHREARLGGAGPGGNLPRQAAGACHVLVLVVVFEIDLVQAGRIGAGIAGASPGAREGQSPLVS